MWRSLTHRDELRLTVVARSQRRRSSHASVWLCPTWRPPCRRGGTVAETAAEGELLFEAYLAEHDYPEPAHAPDLGVRTPPDYVVVRGEAEAICEVEEFDRDSDWSPGNAGPTKATVWRNPDRDDGHAGILVGLGSQRVGA
jgi:hypothetical protein